MASDPLQMLVAQGGGNPYLASVQGQQGLQAGQQQLQAGALQLQAAQAQQAHDQQYQTDVGNYFKDPKLSTLGQLALKYPDKAQAFKDAKAALDDQERQSQLTQYGQLYSAANAGRTDLLIKQATAIKTAEAAQGTDTSEIDDVLGRLQSSDPAAQKEATKQVLALSQMHIASLDPKVADLAVQAAKGKDGYTLNPGDVRFDADNNRVASVDPKPQEPKYEKIDVYDGQGHVIGQKLVDVSTGGGGQASTAGGGSGGGSGQFDPRAFFKSFTLPHEGGYAVHDANGAPVNMGVNQSANPDVDVRNITPEQAADIFVKKYAQGTENMPPALGGVYADTAYINPTRAAQFLKASGGDPAKFLAMRKAWQASLVAKDPEKYGPYQKAWANRNRDLGQYIAQQGGGGAQAQAGGPRVVMDTTAAGGPPVDIKPGDISTVPTQMRGAVQAIVDGRAAAPRPGTRNGEAMLDAVTAFDPTWDSTLQPLRLQAAKQFTGQGSGAQIAASGNRLAYHLNDLWRDSKALSGPDLGWNPLSTLAAHTAQSFQGAAVARYNAVLPFISGELQKLTKNGHITEGETKNIMANLAPGQATANREAAIQQVAELAQGQFKPFRDQWASAFGPDKKPPVDFTPTTQKIFDHITAGQDPLTIDHNGMIVGEKRAQSAPVKVSSPQQAAALPPGTLFQTTDGRVLRRR